MPFRQRLVLRPGRPLAALYAISFWPAWVSLAFACGWLLQMGAVAEWLIVWCLVLGAFGAVVVFVSGRSPSILGVARRPAYVCFAHAVLAVVGMVIGLRMSGFQSWILLVGGGASLVVSVWLLELARRSRSWPTGQLELDGVSARLVTMNTSYFIGEIPDGCLLGDWLTLPDPEIEPIASGPYRSARPVGRVPHALRVQGTHLAKRLWVRGIGHAAFGIISLCWATL